MKIKSWHMSFMVIAVIIISIFGFSGAGATGIGAMMMLSLLPALVWFGWTLHERSLYRNEVLEQKVIDRLRSSDDVVIKRRRANSDV